MMKYKMEREVQKIADHYLIFSTPEKSKAFTKIVMAVMHDVENGIIKHPEILIKGMRDINNGINRGLYGEKSKIQYSLKTSKNKKVKLKN